MRSLLWGSGGCVVALVVACNATGSEDVGVAQSAISVDAGAPSPGPDSGTSTASADDSATPSADSATPSADSAMPGADGALPPPRVVTCATPGWVNIHSCTMWLSNAPDLAKISFRYRYYDYPPPGATGVLGGPLLGALPGSDWVDGVSDHSDEANLPVGTATKGATIQTSRDLGLMPAGGTLEVASFSSAGNTGASTYVTALDGTVTCFNIPPAAFPTGGADQNGVPIVQGNARTIQIPGNACDMNTWMFPCCPGSVPQGSLCFSTNDCKVGSVCGGKDSWGVGTCQAGLKQLGDGCSTSADCAPGMACSGSPPTGNVQEVPNPYTGVCTEVAPPPREAGSD